MKHLLALALALIAALHAVSASAGTHFTYQGRLDASGQPHDGIVGMDFRLYTAPSSGTLLGEDLGNSVQVTDGLFQIVLDFGEQPYEDGLWLGITVNGQTLSPRQAVQGAPFANHAQSTLSAQSLAGDCPSPTGAPDDVMIRVGGICVDVYEASLWDAPVGGNQIIPTGPGDIPCGADGQDCDNIYARSVAGVEPAQYLSWFQAQAALANSGKRLLTNAEWQMAVRGTPDDTGPATTPCNTRSGTGPVNTGASGCVSDFGVHDMVGNLWEFVAEWVPASTGCQGWDTFSDDIMCLSGASETTDGPGALLRGGSGGNSASAGPLAISALSRPSAAGVGLGFRGAR
jgi:hypothetical protein